LSIEKFLGLGVAILTQIVSLRRPIRAFSRLMTMVLVLANGLFSVRHSNSLLGCALHQFFQRLAHSTWRAAGQAFLICLALGGCGATAQNDGPSREAFAEMVAFARLGSVACERLAPDAGFHALALLTLVKPPLTKEEIAAQEKDLERLRERLGLRRWCQLYAGEMEQARILVDVLRRQN
jgi:hypothetical protein